MHSRHHRSNEGTTPANTHDPAQRPDTEQNQVSQVNDSRVKRKHDDDIDRPLRNRRSQVKTASRRDGFRISSSPSIPENSLKLDKGGVCIGPSLPKQHKQVRKPWYKPPRNADGFLIRKDGQPDRRGKRKKPLPCELEQQEVMVSGFTPINPQGKIPGTANCPITRTSLESSTNLDISLSLQRKHDRVLCRMFPDGIGNYVAQLFEGTYTQ
jgi:hypothetical protein